MKTPKLNGRERAVMRAIDFSNGSSGAEIVEHTKIEPEDTVDVLNALLSIGYVETVPYAEQTTLETFAATMFVVNPSYAIELRAALVRNF